MIAHGTPANEICGKDWFMHMFKTAPELQHILVSSGKENFGRCTECFKLEQAVKEARATGDAQALLDVKRARQSHLQLERADKVSYYRWRQKARAPSTSVISCIIDKMDGNKNKLPRCAFQTHLRLSVSPSPTLILVDAVLIHAC